MLLTKERELVDLYQRVSAAERATALMEQQAEGYRYKVSLLEGQLGHVQANHERGLAGKLRETREDVTRMSATLEQRLGALESRLVNKLDTLGTLTMSVATKSMSSPQPNYSTPAPYGTVPPQYFGYTPQAPAPQHQQPGPPDEALLRAMQEFAQRKNE